MGRWGGGEGDGGVLAPAEHSSLLTAAHMEIITDGASRPETTSLRMKLGDTDQRPASPHLQDRRHEAPGL